MNLLLLQNIDNNNVMTIINFLIFSFNYNNKQNIYFKIINNDNIFLYQIYFDINQNKSFLTISKDDIDINNNIIILNEDLLIELYLENASLFKIIKSYFQGKIKSINVSVNNFKNFMKNFDFSKEKWDEYYKIYN